jgi:hypothetical protein
MASRRPATRSRRAWTTDLNDVEDAGVCISAVVRDGEGIRSAPPIS